jgi:hypothetical protein
MKKNDPLSALLLAPSGHHLAAQAFENTKIGVFAVGLSLAIFTQVFGQPVISVLLYGPSGSNESYYLLPTNTTFTAASETTWRAMTTSDFAKYSLIIIDDPTWGADPPPAALLAAYDTRNTWAAAVTGRIVVGGMDAWYHASNGESAAGTYLKASLDWLTKGPVGKTALYVGSDWGTRNLDFLSPFGAFGSSAFTADTIHITSPGHPIMSGSTSASLSGWNQSAHSSLTYPASFSSLATGTDFNFITGTVVVARDTVFLPPSLQPLLPGKCDISGSAEGVVVSGNYAYVAAWNGGLQVIDVRNPANCVRVGGYVTTGWAYGAAVSGNYAFVADGDLQVIDVSDPTNCVRVGGYVTSGTAFGVAISGNYAYVADYDAGLQIFDVSNPTNCMRVGGCDTSVDAEVVAVSGNYAYVTGGLEGGAMEVIDVRNPTNCVRISRYAASEYANGVAVSGNYAYLAAETGLKVIDVSNPYELRARGRLCHQLVRPRCGAVGKLRLPGGLHCGPGGD